MPRDEAVSPHQAVMEALAKRRAEVETLSRRLAEVHRRVARDRHRAQEIRDRARHPRVDALHEAIESRDVIGQAKGMLMASGLTEEEAFDLLRRASQRANLKLRTIAEALVAKRSAGSTNERGPLDRARWASAAMETHRAALAGLAEQRAEAVREALGTGMSRSEVARALGVTPQAVTKLLNRFRPPEDFLLQNPRIARISSQENPAVARDA